MDVYLVIANNTYKTINVNDEELSFDFEVPEGFSNYQSLSWRKNNPNPNNPDGIIIFQKKGETLHLEAAEENYNTYFKYYVDLWQAEKARLEQEAIPTPEEIEAQELAEAKAERAEAVSKIIVEVDGMKFDGDETAQTRMGRTISAAMALGVDLNTEKRTWVLADNTVAKPTIAQLAKALELAGNEQTRLWTVPYQSDSEEDTVAISSIGIV